MQILFREFKIGIYDFVVQDIAPKTPQPIVGGAWFIELVLCEVMPIKWRQQRIYDAIVAQKQDLRLISHKIRSAIGKSNAEFYFDESAKILQILFQFSEHMEKFHCELEICEFKHKVKKIRHMFLPPRYMIEIPYTEIPHLVSYLKNHDNLKSVFCLSGKC